MDLIPQAEKETLKYRLLAVLVVAFALLLEWDEAPLLATFGLVVGYLIYSYLLRTFLIPRFTSYALLAAMLLIDVGTMIGAMYLIALDSPIFALLPIVVVYYALYLGYVGGLAAAVVSSVSYTSLAFGTGNAGEVENLLAFQPVFYILGLLVGYVTQQRFRESEGRQALQQLISAEANAKSLLDLAQALNRVMDPVALSSDMATIGTLVARVPYCVILLHDAEKNALVYQGSNPAEGRLVTDGADGFVQPLHQASFLTSAWTTGRVALSDWLGEDGQEVPRWLKSVNGSKALASPLTNHGDKIGVVCFIADESASDFDEGTVHAIERYSEMAGRFLASTQVYAQAEKRSRRVAAELQQNIKSAGRFRELTQRRSMRFGPMLIEPPRESVRWQDTSLKLTKTEFDLLYLLAEKAGTVLNQETLIREVWGQDFVPQGKVVDVTIHRLRRKLATLPEGRNLIKTVRGQGYTFVPPERFVGTA